MSNPSVRDVLVAARKLIEKPKDWAKAGRAQYHGPRCAGYAIDFARGEDLGTDAFDAFKRVIGVKSIRQVIKWNDAPERTHAEVIAAFDKAIAECTS